MSERLAAVSLDPITNNTIIETTNLASTSRSNFHCLIHALTESVKIFHRNKRVFLSIFALLSLPLSLLLSSLSLSSLPIQTEILRLESLASLAPTRFEYRQLWRESREASLSLLRLKLLYFLPSYLLSLLSAVTSVSAAYSLSSYRKPVSPLKAALTSVKSTWAAAPFITSIYSYVLLLLYSLVPRALSGLVATPGLRVIVRVVGSVAELYVMAITGMGLVVSIVEEEEKGRSWSGWEAIRVGFDVMEGRRVCAWLLSGLLAVVAGGIGWRMEKGVVVVDGGDLSEFRVVVVVGWWERWGLVGLYGVVVVWGYVVFTAFYRECRKRHVVRREDEVVDGGGERERELTSVDCEVGTHHSWF